MDKTRSTRAILWVGLIFVAFAWTVYLGLVVLKNQQSLQGRAAVSNAVAPIDVDSESKKYEGVVSSRKIIVENKGAINSLRVSGNINLQGNNSLVRLVLIDSNKNEYLIYETYSMIADRKSFNIVNQCEETCLLNNVTPASIRVESYQATYFQTKIDQRLDKVVSGKLSNPNTANVLKDQQQKLLLSKQREKLKLIKSKIIKNKLRWKAGDTPASHLTYSQKKTIFTVSKNKPSETLPNIQGFEFYQGGIFEVVPPSTQATSISLLPSKWDWHNLNGENWNTPVKNQGGAANCGPFALVAAFESAINLYYNRHLDKDLSEQTWVDCLSTETPPLGMGPGQYGSCSACNPGNGFCSIQNHGLVDEACNPYAERNSTYDGSNCHLGNICADWQSRLIDQTMILN